MTMEVKTIREGGNNGTQIRLTGPLAFGLLTLKRGMTASFDLWDWFSAIQEPGNGKLRATAQVVLFAASGPPAERCRFVLDRCVPTKLKAPALNAKDGMVAIEEFQLAYESLRLVKPKT
jgi:phage tail-like protein